MRLFEPEWTTGGARQGGQVGAAGQGLAQIAGQRAYVGSRQRSSSVAVGRSAAESSQAVSSSLLMVTVRVSTRLAAVAGQLVGMASGNLTAE